MIQLEDCNWKCYNNLKGGKGAVYLSEESETLSDQTISYICLTPHSSVGLHRHNSDEEIYVVVKGGLMKVNGKDCVVAVCKRGESHDCVNDTEENIYVKSIKATEFKNL